jgi:hypothetical protein
MLTKGTTYVNPQKFTLLTVKVHVRTHVKIAIIIKTIMMKNNNNNKRQYSFHNVNASQAQKISKLGKAPSTDAGNNAAIKYVNDFQQENSMDLYNDLEQIKDEIAKGDEIIACIIKLAEWFSKPVQKRNDNNNGTLSVGTCQEYFGKIKESIRLSSPQLLLWKDHDSGGWYSHLYDAVGKGAKRAIIGGDEDYEDVSARAIPLRTEAGKLRSEQRIWMDKKGSDVESIVRGLIKNGSPTAHEDRCKLLLTVLGEGRGGEIKFLRWNECEWDCIFSCLQIIWTRKKTLVRQHLYFQCFRDGWLCDIYHALESFFALEIGLMRYSHQADGEKK